MAVACYESPKMQLFGKKLIYYAEGLGFIHQNLHHFLTWDVGIWLSHVGAEVFDCLLKSKIATILQGIIFHADAEGLYFFIKIYRRNWHE